MNREIKFRAWHSRLKKMVPPDLYFGKCNHHSPGFELMQFTGIKDKNGKEIYEGDICLILYTDWPSNSSDMPLDEYLKSISHKGIIEYHDFSFYIMIKNRFDELSKNSLEYGKHGRIEIIGNIHENPELS